MLTRNAQRHHSLLVAIVLLISTHSFAQLPAFPGAEGYGRNAQGGRGGEVFFVTSLDDSGPGTLREGVSDRNMDGDTVIPRTIIFRVGGVITLQSSLQINEPYLTIAGQTAPGDGILVRSEPGVDMRVMTIRGNQHLVVRLVRRLPRLSRIRWPFGRHQGERHRQLL